MARSPLEARVRALEARVAALEDDRPGRKSRPILISQEGVCALEPGRESATCPDASTYRRQQGCKGDACVRLTTEYYANYRRERRADATD
jgi:hypothetical protein